MNTMAGCGQNPNLAVLDDFDTLDLSNWRADTRWTAGDLTPGQARSRKVTSTEFEAKTLHRFEQYEHRRRERLLVQKKESMLATLEACTSEPRVNDTARNDKRNPLVARLDEILETRKVKLEARKKTFVSREEREARECTFRPNINSTYRLVTSSVNRSVDDLFKWQEKRNMRLMEKSMDSKFNHKECSFTPEISKQSRRLAKKKENNKEFQRVEDRLLGYIQKTKTGAVTQASQQGTSIQRSSVGPSVVSHTDSPRTKKAETEGTPQKHGNSKSVYDIQEEMEAVYESSHKLDGQTDCNKDLMFSFKGYHMEPVENGETEADCHIDDCASMDSHHKYSKISAAFESVLNKKPEKDREKTPGNLRELTKIVREPARLLEASRDISQPRDVSIRALKRSAHLPRKEEVPRPAKVSRENTARESHQGVIHLASRASNAEAKSKTSILKTAGRSKSPRQAIKTVQSSTQESRKAESKLGVRFAPSKDDRLVDKTTAVVYKCQKTELAEKYSGKVKPPSVACSEIQQSVFAGETTSMLQNLKKLNSNLRLCSNLECIIKKTDKHNDSARDSLENRPPVFPKHGSKDGQKAQTGAPPLKAAGQSSRSRGRNPFLELVNGAHGVN